MCNGGFMTEKLIRYLKVLEKVEGGEISQEQAEEELIMSVRQVYRLYEKPQKDGPGDFLSKKYGKPSNHQLPKIIKARVFELIAYEKYEGFGPPFMWYQVNEKAKIKGFRNIFFQRGNFLSRKSRYFFRPRVILSL